MRTLYKVAIGSVIGLAVVDKLGVVDRLARPGDTAVHGKEWADAKYAERRGLAARGRRRTVPPLWESRDGRYSFERSGDRLYLRDNMYGDTEEPQFTPDGRGVQWSRQMPSEVSRAAIDLIGRQRVVPRFGEEGNWKSRRTGWAAKKRGRSNRVLEGDWRFIEMPAKFCPAMYGNREKHGHIYEAYGLEPAPQGPWVDKDGTRFNLYNIIGRQRPEIRWSVSPGHEFAGEREFATRYLDLFPASALED